MNYFSIKTSVQESVQKILSNAKIVEFGTLSGHKEIISIGDIVFVVVSGDNAKKEFDYENGLKAIGKIISLPIMEDKTHFKLEVELLQFLPKIITKNDFYNYPSLKDVSHIGVNTKGIPNQAFGKILKEQAQDVIRAIKNIYPELKNDLLDSIVDRNYNIEKLSLSNHVKSGEIFSKSKIEEYIQNCFIKWVEHPDNYKKSYDGLVTKKVLNFWNEAFFNNSLFLINVNDVEESIFKIEKLINRENSEWRKYSQASSNGAPEAIIGKKNYLRFLNDFLNLDDNIKYISEINQDSQEEISQEEISQESFLYKNFHVKAEEAGLLFSEKMTARFIASLCAKPFVICSGLSGSGKTKLAQSFVMWICENEQQYLIIPVGADWTNREPLLGFPNGLDNKDYVFPDSGALQLIIEASKVENKNKPYFLILDEMNLSHVERYFADFLSIMESRDKITLYSGQTRTSNELEISSEISWPKNLFIVGTVNIDETTYMFSPKVLDRANVIEFRLNHHDLQHYLENGSDIDLKKLINNNTEKGYGAPMAEIFLHLANQQIPHDIDLKPVLITFFNELQKSGAEFGYRTVSEINSLVSQLKMLSRESGEWENFKESDFIDIGIMQKLLPKLHGSRSKLSRVLPIIGMFCLNDSSKIKENYFEKFDLIDFENDDNINYKISFEKICRMYKNAIDNGYASYAEA